LLLRISPRRTLCESVDLEEILETAFRAYGKASLDLQPSTYQVDHMAEVPRVKAEHAAAAPLDPPTRGSGAFDMQDLVRDVRVEPGKALFAFLAAAHRNAHFESETQLREAVSKVVAERNERMVVTPKVQLAAYARGRVKAADPEWAHALDQMHESRRKLWAKFCA
jgi:hypothetical protein